MLTKSRSAGLGPGQVDGLHQSHRLGRRGYPLGHNAVVSGEDQKVLFFDFIVDPSGDTGQLDAQVLQPTQAPGGLRQLGLPLPGGGHGRLIQGTNLPIHFHQITPFSFSQPMEGSASISSRV